MYIMSSFSSSVDTSVCDELLLGIPYKAWWVVALAILCLGIAFTVPSFLPLYLLPKNEELQLDRVSKTSWQASQDDIFIVWLSIQMPRHTACH
jgi:membrane-anchored glycerophosphoryl diester phosphodiesterase (GDPDase)